MAKKKKGMGGFNVPIVVFRTPEQHRAIIQPVVKATPLAEPKFPRSRAKRVRLSKCGNGTSSLSARMLALGVKKYADYLATAHWLDVKARWKASSLFRGWVCSSNGCDSRKGLSLHHWTYERVGNEELTDLVLVCEDCHKRIHHIERRGTDLREATRRVTGIHVGYAS